MIPCLIQKLAEAMTKLLKGNKKSIDFAKKWFIRSAHEFCYIFIAYYFTKCIFYYVHIEKLKGIEDFLYGDRSFTKRDIIPNIFDKKQVGRQKEDDPTANFLSIVPGSEKLKNVGKEIGNFGKGIGSLKEGMGNFGKGIGSLKDGIGSGMNMLGIGMGSITTIIFGYFTACMYVLPNIFSFSLSTVLPKLFEALKIQDSYACTFLLIFVIMYIIVYFLLHKFGQMFLNVFYWKPDKSMIIFIIIGWIISFGDLMKIPKGPNPHLEIQNNLKRLQVLGPTLIIIGYLVHLAVSLGLSGVATLLFLFFFFSTCLGIFLPSDCSSKVAETVIYNSIPKTKSDTTSTEPDNWTPNPLFDPDILIPKNISDIKDANDLLNGQYELSKEAEVQEEQTETDQNKTDQNKTETKQTETDQNKTDQNKTETKQTETEQNLKKTMNLNSFLQSIYPYFLNVIFLLYFFYKFLESIIFLSKPSTSSRGTSGLIGFWAPIVIINLIAFMICFCVYVYYSENKQIDNPKPNKKNSIFKFFDDKYAKL